MTPTIGSHPPRPSRTTARTWPPALGTPALGTPALGIPTLGALALALSIQLLAGCPLRASVPSRASSLPGRSLIPKR